MPPVVGVGVLELTSLNKVKRETNCVINKNNSSIIAGARLRNQYSFNQGEVESVWTTSVLLPDQERLERLANPENRRRRY